MKKIDTPIYLEIFFEDTEDLNQDLGELLANQILKRSLKQNSLKDLSKQSKKRELKLLYLG